MTPFEAPIVPDDVADLIDLSVEGRDETAAMAELQRKGIAALYNILCERSFAFLADEVGMGKTYQAMGLAALLWNDNPHARVVFISPRQHLQTKWVEDYRRFFASNYRRPQGLGDDRVASTLFREPVHRPMYFDNLRSWTPTIGMRERIAPFFRHTSFTRPVYVTGKDLQDIRSLWPTTADKFRAWGLYEIERPARLTRDNAPRELNLAFARALNARLAAEADGAPYFDLAVIDEAQCLRNPDNQTNQVLHEALRGQVRKWLYMSATPAHGGPEDLPTILNHYPGQGEVLDPTLCAALPDLQRALQSFMVRRPRKYRASAQSSWVDKTQYRSHDPQRWAVTESEMSTLGTLAMGLVQKGLVGVLQGRSNRFRVGFLSSFESLQSSIVNSNTLASATDDAGEEEGDWHRDKTERSRETEAPDTEFVQRLNDDFQETFGRPLPHPKVDAVVDQIAPLAFGNDERVGGEKFLVFTRRVSTVETLRKRLMDRYHESLERRVQRCWGATLQWDGPGSKVEDPTTADGADDPEADDAEDSEGPFRKAMAKGGWLFRYRQTFRTSGRNATVLEDGWLRRLCEAGVVDPARAADQIPVELWAESLTHASHPSGSKSDSRYRADRLRYLALHGVRRYPGVFGLSDARARPWQIAYAAALHAHLERAEPHARPDRALELVTQRTLWTAWDERFAGTSLALPASDVYDTTEDVLCQRQVVRSLLSQVFRLSDTILDLYYADEAGGRKPDALPDRFLDWLTSSDPAAEQLKHDCEHWIAHTRLIVDTSLDGAGRSWRNLARSETWDQLFKLMPVMGVTGKSSRARQAPTRQFRTPSHPRVIICTDTLKEGVDLHLFCDRVVHYGVAWTSGDMEQRVGRVDRYFSQIERRLRHDGAPPEVSLSVGYPHIAASLERQQIERVIDRQQRAEKLMSSPLAGATKDETEITLGQTTRIDNVQLEPFAPQTFPTRGRSVVAVPEAEARAVAEHYASWYRALLGHLRESGWEISPPDERPVRAVTMHRSSTRHEVQWAYDGTLGRYTLTITPLPRWPEADGFTGGVVRRVVDRVTRRDGFVRMLVPNPDEGTDLQSIRRFCSALGGEAPEIDDNAEAHWHDALTSIASGTVEWRDPHKARLRVARGDRGHEVILYAYEGGVRIIGVVARLSELDPRPEWNGAPNHDTVTHWCQTTNNDLPLGYLDVHTRDGLVFGVHVLHGALSVRAREELVREVAWRADLWEAALTGEDRY